MYFFHILVIQEYGVLTESRIPLKPVLGEAKVAALSINTQTDSVLLVCCCSLYSSSIHFRDYLYGVKLFSYFHDDLIVLNVNVV